MNMNIIYSKVSNKCYYHDQISREYEICVYKRILSSNVKKLQVYLHHGGNIGIYKNNV